jgi:hypothetical protein
VPHCPIVIDGGVGAPDGEPLDGPATAHEPMGEPASTPAGAPAGVDAAPMDGPGPGAVGGQGWRAWSRRRRVRGVAITAVIALVATLAVLAASGGDGDELDEVQAAAAADEPGSDSTTSTTRRRDGTTTSGDASTSTSGTDGSTSTSSGAPSTSSTAARPPATTAPPTTAARPPATTAPTAPPGPVGPGRGLVAFEGLGAWVDVLDWSPTYTGGKARMDPSEVDTLADEGVQTLYIQTARFNRPEDILDESLLRSIIDRAHARGLRVVGWYLPTFHDLGTDLRRLEAIAGLGVDAVGVDIEDRSLADTAERNRRLLQLSADLRVRLPNHPLAAIVFPPVVTDVINPAFWPDFPWAALVPSYDVWVPMSYWTNRTPESGWRDGYRYTAENIDLLRARTGRPDLPIHTVGGIADEISPADVDAMAWAVAEKGVLGGSLYDLRTTGSGLWNALRALRR